MYEALTRLVDLNKRRIKAIRRKVVGLILLAWVPVCLSYPFLPFLTLSYPFFPFLSLFFPGLATVTTCKVLAAKALLTY